MNNTDLRDYLLDHKQITANIAQSIFTYVTQNSLVEVEFEDKKTLFITINGDTDNLFAYFMEMAKNYNYIKNTDEYDSLENVQECCFAAETKKQAKEAVNLLKQLIPTLVVK